MLMMQNRILRIGKNVSNDIKNTFKSHRQNMKIFHQSCISGEERHSNRQSRVIRINIMCAPQNVTIAVSFGMVTRSNLQVRGRVALGQNQMGEIEAAYARGG